MEVPDLELSFWPILFLVAAGQAIFFSGLVMLSKEANQRSKIYLALILLLFGYMLFFQFAWWTKYNYHFPHVIMTNLPLYYTFGPLLFLYLDSLRQKPGFQKFSWLHFIPALVMFVFLTPFYLESGPEKLSAITGNTGFPIIPYTRPFWHLSKYYSFGLQMLIYLLLQIWLFQKIKKEEEIAGLPDQLQSMRRRWFRIIIALYAVYTFSFLAYFPLSNQSFFLLVHDFIISGVMTIAIYTIGFLGYKRSAIFSGNLLPQVFTAKKYASSSLTSGAVRSIQQMLLKYMEQQKPYRNPELKIGMLAQALDVSTHQLSQVINHQLGKSFNQFINDYRIQEAQALLKQPDHAKTYIIDIAYQVGFNNKTTFNTAFKRLTGLAPSQYRQQFIRQEGDLQL